MKERTVAFVIFFSLVFLLIKIKFSKFLWNIRKRDKETLKGGLFFWESVFCSDCNQGICKSIIELEKREIEKEEEEAIKREIYSKTPEYRTKEESKVLKLAEESEKTSIWWLSTTANVAKERVIEIFTVNSGYLIDDEYIYNEKKMTKEAIRKVKEKIMGWKICPNCENPTDEGSDFCPNCGEKIDRNLGGEISR